MKKVLITGATGFIGNHIVPILLSHGYDVVASSLHQAKAEQQEWYSSATYIPFDLAAVRPGVNYFEFFGRPDFLIHLTWEGLPNYKAPFHVEINLPRHFSFLSNLIENGLKSLTVTGTCFEYGMKEGCLTEEMPAAPANSYAVAKDALRKKLTDLQNHFRFDFKWVRLFYLFGKGQHPNSILAQLERALANGDRVFNMSGGEQIRDYLPVTRAAEHVVAIAGQNKVQGIINCCSGRPVSIKQLVNNYLAEHNASIELNLGYYPYPDYEPMAFWGDNRKLMTIAGDPSNK